MKENAWTIGKLQALLFDITTLSVSNSAAACKTICIVDAVDECISGKDRERLLKNFEKIVQKCRHSPSRVCFIVSSRPYPSIAFPDIDVLSLDSNIETAVDRDL